MTSSSSQTPPKSNVTDLAGIGLSHGPSTRRAVLLVFPHRKELSIYGAHIEDTFLANPSTPYRVLDRRVRTRVAESPRIRLSDVSAFFPDYAYSNLNTGTVGRLGALRGPGQAGCGQRERSPEVCRRFNFASCRDAGSRPNSNSMRHTSVCFLCRSCHTCYTTDLQFVVTMAP